MTNKQKDILSSHDKENTQSEKLLKQGNLKQWKEKSHQENSQIWLLLFHA